MVPAATAPGNAMAELTLHPMPSSGNSCKVRRLLAHLGLRHRPAGGDYGPDALEASRAAGKLPLDHPAALPGHVAF